MERLCYLIAIFALVLSLYTQAQEDLAGTWQGTLTVSPELELTVQFVISQENGTYTALIDSPDNNAINNIPASSVNISGNQVSLIFNNLNGEFNGQLNNGVLDGEWSQLTESFPLSLTPFFVNQLTDAQIAMLLGEWSGRLPAPANFDVIFRFAQNEDSLLTGSLSVPAQGAEDIALDEFSIVDNEFTFNIPRINGRYEGVFSASGLELTGTFTQGQELALNLVKGEYVASPETLLNLSEADQQRLLGSWSGQLGPLAIVLRFERDAEGSFVSVVDSPTQGATDLQVTEVSVIDSRLTLKLALGAEFTGIISGDEITGTWTQGGMTNPLTVARD